MRLSLLPLLLPLCVACTVSSPSLTLTLHPDGSVATVSNFSVAAATTPANTAVVSTHVSANGSACVVKREYANGVASVGVYAATASSVRYDVVFTAAKRVGLNVTTSLALLAPNPATAWFAPLSANVSASNASWSPLVPIGVPTGTESFEYGGDKFAVLGGVQNAVSLTIPFVAVMGASSTVAVALDPTDDTSYMTLAVGGTPSTWAFHRRLQSAGRLHLGMDFLAINTTCWRPVLGWYHAKYRELFRPSVPVRYGAGTYAYFFNQTTQPARHYAAMGLATNWDASFPWVYHGPWVPFNNASYFPITETASGWAWLNCDPAGHGGHAIPPPADYPACLNQTYAMLRGWYSALKARLGVDTLVYGTLVEFGIGIDTNLSAPVAACGTAASNYTGALVCGANTLLRDRFPTAFIRSVAAHNQPVHGSWSSVIVDPGDADYAEFMVENARRVVSEFGSTAAGVCIDRGDFLGAVNAGADDGVAWHNGAPARSLLTSWKATSGLVADVLHGANMSLYLNPDFGARIDTLRHVDGLYDEQGDEPHWRMADGWLCSGGRPCIEWCHNNLMNELPRDCQTIMENGTTAQRHAYMQSHVLIGVAPSVPFPDNDHMILPTPAVDAFFTLYGALVDAASVPKLWFTAPHAVVTVGPTAAVNAFQVLPEGSGVYLVAVTFAAEPTVVVRLQNLPAVVNTASAIAIRPGDAVGTGVSVPVTPCADGEGVCVEMTAPVVSGCALLRVSVA